MCSLAWEYYHRYDLKRFRRSIATGVLSLFSEDPCQARLFLFSNPSSGGILLMVSTGSERNYLKEGLGYEIRGLQKRSPYCILPGGRVWRWQLCPGAACPASPPRSRQYNSIYSSLPFSYGDMAGIVQGQPYIRALYENTYESTEEMYDICVVSFLSDHRVARAKKYLKLKTNWKKRSEYEQYCRAAEKLGVKHFRPPAYNCTEELSP